MSDVDEDARRIAERGRDALLARLRPAFREAAQAHRGEVNLDDAQLEHMVQRAADEADALQWRRALAAAAMEDLGLELGEALEHPAVARAHEIVGAPSYEDALARLGLSPPQARDVAQGEPEPAQTWRDETELSSEPETDETELSRESRTDQTEPSSEPWGQESVRPSEPWGDEEDAGEFRLAKPDAQERARAPFPAFAETTARESRLELVCTHLGGIADLASSEQGVELWFSEHGVDIIRPTKEPLGRLRWDELRAIEVVGARGRFARRRAPHAYLVIRGARGDASFEVPGSSPAELRDRLAGIAGQNVPIVM